MGNAKRGPICRPLSRSSWPANLCRASSMGSKRNLVIVRVVAFEVAVWCRPTLVYGP